MKGDVDPDARWTEHEPCRFSVEFWGVENLKPSHRLYSNTVWCMGSLWNVYVQIVRKKGLQLGVYLQRQSFVDAIPPHSVPALPAVCAPRSTGSSLGVSLHPSASVPSFTDRPATPMSPRPRPWAIPNANSTSFLPLTRTVTVTGSPTQQQAGAGITPPQAPTPLTSLPSSSSSSSPLTAPSSAPHSPYRDPRQSIRAYFSISCPSATGSSSTKFSSAPDTFNVTQSWGWKSSKAEEWVDFDAVEEGGSTIVKMATSSSVMPRIECSLRATIVLGVV